MSDQCILCGKCLEVCPLLGATGREELSPRAKAELCRVLADSPDELSETKVARLAGLCLGCGRCREVCSQGVDVPGLVAALRGSHPDLKSWLWRTWLAHAKQLWCAGSSAAKFVPERFHTEKLGPMLKMLAGLKGGPGLEPFVEIADYPDTLRGEKVLLFAGCTANSVQGRWLIAALKLLDGLGAEVLPADFGCCGSGLKTAGFAQESREMAERNIEIWRKTGRPKLVTFCTSCHAGLMAYAECFERVEEKKNWQANVIPLSIVLRDCRFEISDISPKRLGYHRPCHAEKADPDGAFLQAALGDLLAASTDKQCCGFGGIMRLGAPGLTEPVNRECWDRLEGMETVLSGCSACLAQLSATAPDGVQVGHWLEILK